MLRTQPGTSGSNPGPLNLESYALPQCHHFHMSRVMRKPDFCLCEKGADQLRSNCEADQCICFHYLDSTISLLPKSEISSFYPSSVLVQLGLCQTWLETPKTAFSRRSSYELNGYQLVYALSRIFVVSHGLLCLKCSGKENRPQKLSREVYSRLQLTDKQTLKTNYTREITSDETCHEKTRFLQMYNQRDKSCKDRTCCAQQ